MPDDGRESRSGTRTIPFFGKNDVESMRIMTSHLDHRLEKYRQDLVKVVQRADLIIRGLDQAAEKESFRNSGLPGDGVRRLSCKLKRKLEKIPPRWQVNVDVLSWLLRPVPFVAGLPAPHPHTSPPATERSQSSAEGDASAQDPQHMLHEAVIVGASFDVSTGSTTPARRDENGGLISMPVEVATTEDDVSVLERRAAPVMCDTDSVLLTGLGGDTSEDGDGNDGDGMRKGFHAYDETHQVFIHILRDWTAEGEHVRQAVYAPLLRALDLYVGWQDSGKDVLSHTQANRRPLHQRNRQHVLQQNRWRRRGRRRLANVLVPGAGLGRLAAEIAARGYASVHANELSPTMLAACHWLFEALRSDQLFTTSNGEIEPLCSAPSADNTERDEVVPATSNESNAELGDAEAFQRRNMRDMHGKGDQMSGYFQFYPFLNDAPHNEMDGEARFRPALFPDAAGRSLLARASERLSFQAGEFTKTYGAAGTPFESTFDAIVTSFFVDTAPNVLEYVATIRRTLRPGGVWINCGPLHWHTRSVLALSLDEMLALIAGSGFRLETVEILPPCGYRAQDSTRSLHVDEFKPVFWVAILEGGSPKGGMGPLGGNDM